MTWVLNKKPDWHAAAQSLVNGCSSVDTNEQRVRLMERLCASLGDELYPAFLNILCVISLSADQKAQILVAETLVHALTTGRLPSGKRVAWGAEGASAAVFGQTRSLGPIEYLCAWYAQPTGSKPLTAAAFYRIAHALISLISVEEKAKALYCAKLRADVADPIEGALARSTRQALSEMIQAWEEGGSPENVVSSFQNALHGSGLGHLATHPSSFLR